MLKHKIKNEEGSGLVLTLMVLLVLSVLGVSLATVTMGSNRLGHATQDSNSAYYIAEAGANMAYEEIRQGVVEAYENNNEQGVKTTINSLPDKYNNFDIQSGHQPEAHVSVSDPETEGSKKTYRITSTGKIGPSSRTVTKEFVVTWVNKGTSESDGGFLNPGNGGAILANENIIFTAGKIHGDVYLDSSAQGSFSIDNTVQSPSNIITSLTNNKEIYSVIGTGWIKETLKEFEKKTRTEVINYDWELHSNSIPSITEIYNKNNIEHKDQVSNVLDQFNGINVTNLIEDYELSDEGGYNKHKVQNNGNLYLNHYLVKDKEYVLPLLENTYIPYVEITGGQTLKINTSGNNVILMIDNLNFSGSAIEILGGGTVTFYINNSMSFSSDGSINEKGNKNSFNLYHVSSETADFSNLSTLNGNVYVKTAGVKLSGVKISGPVFVGGNKNVNYIGGSTGSFYAPNSNVNLSSGTVNGSLTSKDLEMGGSAKIHGDVNANNFNMFSGSLINGNVTVNKLSMDGAGTINGGVSAKTIDMPSGARINGYVVSEDVSLTGGAKITGAVGAYVVDLDSGGHIEGNVVANKLLMEEGGPTITYKEIDFSNYPFDIPAGGGNGTPGTDDLISSGPAIEK